MTMINIGGPNTTSKLTGIQEGDVQPNAVDLRLGKVFAISNNTFEIDAANNKKHRGSTEIEPDENGFWYLTPGVYEFICENIIEVGMDESGFVITRSTLNRNGCFITSGLYDSGYHGVMAGCLHVEGGPIKIQKGTRVGQYLNWKAESVSKYNGSYGLNSEHDKKYQ